ncbi:MAG: uncharacterized membrane protein YraQ (UPF0718 family), partial [Candidatus Azotimanducaceae bacterium]
PKLRPPISDPALRTPTPRSPSHTSLVFPYNVQKTHNRRYTRNPLRVINKKKIALLAILAALILGTFLSVSRAPALDEKALMGTRTDVVGIAFEQLLEVSSMDHRAVRIAKHAVNWTYTNWRGMTFGILFGATILTLLRALPLRQFSGNRFSAALQGLIGGAPLGVCVNCATPVAQGLLSAGIRVETSLTAMMASPTLNFIVISMMLALFPSHFVFLKLLFTALFIVLIVPLVVAMTRSSIRSTLMPRVDAPSFSAEASSELLATWGVTTREAVVEWIKNFLLLVRVSVPLMLVAGVLGAAVIEYVPLEALSGLAPGFWTYLAVAVVGTLLPVPIAFDVVLTAGLMAAGFPAGLAMTLFCALSIFSVFPALIIARDVSARLSLGLSFAVVLFSMGTGYTAQWLNERFVEQQTKALERTLMGSEASGSQTKPESIDVLRHKVELGKQLCGELGEVLPDCRSQLFDSDSFGFAETALCHELERIDPEFGAECFLREDKREESRAAIAADDIGRCRSDDCRFQFLKAYSSRPSSGALCEELTNGAVDRCKRSVLRARLEYFRTAEACDVVAVDDPASCLRELDLLIAIEQIDAEVCRSLPIPDNKQCMMAYLSGKIFDTRGQYNCSSFRFRDYQGVCDQLVMSHQAERSGNWANCLSLPKGLSPFCVGRVINARVKSERGVPEVLPDLTDAGSPSVNGTADFSARSIRYEDVSVEGSIRLRRIHHAASATTGKFQRHVAGEIGMPHFWRMNSTDMFEPFGYGKGIASGDLDRDGFPDVAIAYEKGVYIYRNLGEGKFELAVNLQPDEDFNAFVVALVDFNNDGQLDVFITGYGGKRVVYLNHAGQFESVIDLPVGETPVTIAAGFADLDRDGVLDMVFGNWAYGVERNFNTDRAGNELWFHEGNTLSRSGLFDEEPAGQTLSVLLSDLNGDAHTDIVIGNDRQVPDVFYLADGDGGFSYPRKGFVSETSLNTMSYESADFNNDLRLDLFSTDMKFDASGRSSFCADLPFDAARVCSELTKIETVVDQHDVSGCLRLEKNQIEDCLIAVAMTLAIREQQPSLCEKIPRSMASKRQFCLIMSAELPELPDIALEQYPTQVTGNRMHWGRNDFFLDVTDALSVSRTNWSWNARALDVNHDGFLDLFVGNGYGFGSEGRSQFLPDIQVHSNVFFRNDRAAAFVSAAAEFGLVDFANTPSFTILDVDADGDLDILTYAQIAGPTLYENRVSDKPSITFSLTDEQGNSGCVGCRIIIETESVSQMREIKLSGGFLSFDQTIAHFGLDNGSVVTGISVVWSTGETTVIDKKLDAGYHYEITRQ